LKIENLEIAVVYPETVKPVENRSVTAVAGQPEYDPGLKNAPVILNRLCCENVNP
jgi:hypothetical protein